MLWGFLAYFVFSIFTPAEDAQQIEAFFDKMRRKSDADSIGPDGKLPMARDTGDDPLLLDLPGWRKKERWQTFFHRYGEDLVSFVFTLVFIGLIILLAWGILQIRR